MDGHAEAWQRDMELAYYNAWHSGMFSQPFKPRQFPEYHKYAPTKRKRGTGAVMTPKQMKAQAMAIVAALGGTIRKRGQ